MNQHKRLSGTVGGRMGIPIIDGPHPYFRTLKATTEEPILLTDRKPSLPPPPPHSVARGQHTIEIDPSDEGVEFSEDKRPAPPGRGFARPPMMAPPPKRERPVAQPRKPEEALPQEQPEEAHRPSPESAAFSLEELIAVASGKKKPTPIPKPDSRPEESSVMRSMADLQELERQRVADEAAAREQEAADEQSLEANLLRLLDDHHAEAEEEKRRHEKSLLDSLEHIHEIGRQKAAEEAGPSLLAEYGGEPEADAKPETDSQMAGQSGPFIFLDPEVIEPEITDMSISIELVFGLPWEDQHMQYKMSGRELESCEKDLPEREVKWMLPVPPKDSKNKGEITILQQFARETRREFNGREYYIIDAPFAEAKRVARTGCLLHIWPENATDYEFLGNTSGETDLSQPMTGEWSINMKAHILSQEELFRYSALLPEGKPVFLHPVPIDMGQGKLEEDLMEAFLETRIPRIKLGKKEYFTMDIGSMAQWQEISFMFPNMRIASRKGEWLGIWPESELGREMLDFRNGFELACHGPMGPPLLENGGMVRPYPTELPGIKRLYTAGEKRWLMPIPERVGEMDSETLNFLTVVSCREIELGGITPLISLGGRFYVSLKYEHPDGWASVLEGDAIRVFPKKTKLRDALADAGPNAAEPKAAGERPMIVLPPDPEQRKPLIDMFPEGQTMYLYFVDPRNKGYVAMKPHVALMRGNEKEIYLVLKEPYDGSIAVRREGIAIYPIE